MTTATISPLKIQTGQYDFNFLEHLSLNLEDVINTASTESLKNLAIETLQEVQDAIGNLASIVFSPSAEQQSPADEAWLMSDPKCLTPNNVEQHTVACFGH